MSPWKAAGPDEVQENWIKGITTLHRVVAHQLNDIVKSTKVPSWLTNGRTVLITKKPSKK